MADHPSLEPIDESASLRIRQAEEAAEASARLWQTLAAFSAEMGVALSQSDRLQEMLQRCAAAMVRHLDAAFARIWTVTPGSDVLQLQASAGLYTHLDGPHSRIAVGQYKIGRIAQERRPHLTNDLPNDPLISDPEWARREGMVAFAGHPLIVAGQLVGVMALFARRPLTDFSLRALAFAADSIAVGIQRRRVAKALRQAEDRFRGIFENAVEGIFQSTPSGRFIVANPALAAMLGYASPEELIARVNDIAEQIHVNPQRRDELARLLEQQGFVKRFEAQVYRQDRSTIWISINATAVRSEAGDLLYYEGMVENITEYRRAEEMLRARASQQEAVAALGRRALEIPNLSRLLEEASSLVARTLGVEYAAVWELVAGDPVLRLRAGAGWKDGYVRHTTVGPGSPSAYLVLTREPLVVEDCGRDARFEMPPVFRDHGVTSAVGVLVQGRRRPLGALFAYAKARRPFGRDDVHFLQGIANVLGAAIERRRAEKLIRTTQEEVRVARKIQQKLFPHRPPRWPGFDIGAWSHAAEATGGDYFDFLSMPEGYLGISIGDVSGHGFGPALLMAEARAYLRAFAQTHADVSRVLALANRALAEDIEEDRFISLLFARIDPSTRSLVYASAGHLPGYLVDASGELKGSLESTGIPLGLLPETEFPSAGPVPLEPGDVLFLFTDGVVDARAPDGGEVFGMERALEVVRANRHEPAQHIVDHLYGAVCTFTRNEPQWDDITAVVVKVGDV